MEEGQGLAKGVCLEGRLGRDSVLGFSPCHIAIWHLFAIQGAAGVLRRALAAGCRALPCLVGGLNLVTLSAHLNRAVSWWYYENVWV